MKLSADRSFAQLFKIWEKFPTIAWIASILALLIISWLALFWNLGSTGLVDETEPLFAEAARQMTVTGQWITPFFNGATRFDKPPLIYWLMAIAYQTLGVNELATRLPSALAAFALTGLGFYTLLRFGFPTPLAAQPSVSGRSESVGGNTRFSPPVLLRLTAWMGAVMMVLNPETIIWGRMGLSDMLLTACVAGSLLAFFMGYAQPIHSRLQVGWYLGFYGLMGLGVLTKGPVAIVLPGLIIGCFSLYLGNWRSLWREILPLKGSALLVALVLPWYLLVTWQNGEAFINSFFGYHNLERFATAVNYHSGPWYSYFPILLLGFAPWAVYLPAALVHVRLLQRQQWQQQPRRAQLSLFCAFWFLVIFIFFSVAATKRPSYILPLIPASAILVSLLWGDYCSRWQQSEPDQAALYRESRTLRPQLRFSIGLNVVLFIALAIALWFTPQLLADDPSMPDFPQALQLSGIPLVSSAIWGGAAIATVLLVLKGKSSWVWAVNCITLLSFIVLAVMPAAFVMDTQRQLPLRQLAEEITQIRKPAEEVLMVGFEKPSLVFYLQDAVTYIDEPAKAIAYIQQAPQTQPSANSLLLLGYPRKIEEIGLQPSHYQSVTRAGAYQLIRVSQPALRGEVER